MNLKLNESKQGIRCDDQKTLSVIALTARYTETTLKLLSSYDENNPRKEDTEQILTNIIKVQQVQMHYLQDEYASLIVQGRFDKATSQTFKALQKNTSGLNAHALQNLKVGYCNLVKYYQQRINQGVNWQRRSHRCWFSVA